MKPSELEAAIAEHLRAAVDIKDMTDNGGYGLVRYTITRAVVDLNQNITDEVEVEHVVHRWAVKDTADRDIPFRLYSGYYAEEEADARDEYRYREDRVTT